MAVYLISPLLSQLRYLTIQMSPAFTDTRRVLSGDKMELEGRITEKRSQEIAMLSDKE
jgi:hypothetical protein